MKRPRIFFVKKFDANAKFVTDDIGILKREFDVKLFDVKISKNVKGMMAFIGLFLYSLFNLWRFEILYIWFADYHSFPPILFAKLYKKKSIICAGGYECTYIPEINCGVFTSVSWTKKARKFATTFSLKNCGIILPVDKSLIQNSNTYIYSEFANKEPLEDGIKNFIPNIRTKIEPLHLGYDASLYHRNSKKEYSVISAGLIVNNDEYRRKGFDLLVGAARVMQNVKFVLIGLNDNYYEKLIDLNIYNLELHGVLNYERLISEYGKAKVYAQISMFEGMPSSLCEAMLCECVPVGSNVNAIPYIIDDCGFLVYNKKLEEVIFNLKRALDSSEDIGRKARKRVMENFTLEVRREKLMEILKRI